MSSPQVPPAAETPLASIEESANVEMQEVLAAVGIFFAFAILAIIWKKVFLAIVRCHWCKIQRWKSLRQLEHILDLYDHVQHNTMTGLPSNFDANDGAVRNGFLDGGVPLDLFVTNMDYPSGVRLEVDAVPRPIHLSSRQSTSSFNGLSSPPREVEEEYIRIKRERFFNLWPWDEEFYSSSDAKKRKRGCCRNILQALRNIIRCKGVHWWKNGVSGNSSSSREYGQVSASTWKKDSHRLKDLPMGYSFKGGHWIPRTIEGRSTWKYLRGNFLNLVASIGSLGLMLGGVRLALMYANIDLTATFTTATGIALISFFKISENFTPVIDHFSLLFTDYVERGDLVEISPNLGGLNSAGYSLAGCIMDIGVFHVTLLCTKSYKTLSSIIGQDRFLNSQGRLVPSTYFQTSAAGTPGVVNNTHNPAPQPTTYNETSGSHSLPPTASTTSTTRVQNSCPYTQTAEYLERDFIKTKTVVRIPIHVFTTSIVARNVSWIPVVNLQQVNRYT